MFWSRRGGCPSSGFCEVIAVCLGLPVLIAFTQTLLSGVAFAAHSFSLLQDYVHIQIQLPVTVLTSKFINGCKASCATVVAVISLSSLVEWAL